MSASSSCETRGLLWLILSFHVASPYSSGICLTIAGFYFIAAFVILWMNFVKALKENES